MHCMENKQEASKRNEKNKLYYCTPVHQSARAGTFRSLTFKLLLNCCGIFGISLLSTNRIRLYGRDLEVKATAKQPLGSTICGGLSLVIVCMTSPRIYVTTELIPKLKTMNSRQMSRVPAYFKLIFHDVTYAAGWPFDASARITSFRFPYRY
ncbi:hypothetical protein F4779DRAFT_77799 [Xylariaceae sp. FL0662B]|nr:hypothetical protein F4779DRAFT_77799 [Xylariaceae sp. FL0662B]